MPLQDHHIEQIANTRATLQSSLDVMQIAIETDQNENFVYKDDDGTYHIVANLNEDASFANLTVTGSLTYAGFTLSGFTQGSVLFTGADGTVAEDNANFFYDDTNNRLGIGTAVPSVDAGIHIYSNVSAEAPTLLLEQNASPGNAPIVKFKHNNAPVDERLWVFGANSSGQLIGIAYSDDLGTNNSWLTIDRTGAAINYTRLYGSVGIGANPAALLHTLGITEQFRISYDATSYTAFTQADTTGVLTIDPTGNCAKGYVVVDGAVKADSLAINGSVESYMVAIKSTSNTSQNFLLCEDSDGTDMVAITSDGSGNAVLQINNTSGTGNVQITAGTNPVINMGEAISAGNYGYVKWDSTNDKVIIGTNTGGDSLSVLETGQTIIKTSGNVSQELFVCEDSDGTDMLRVLSDSSGNAQLFLNDTSGTIQFQFNTGTDPTLRIGDLMISGGYGFIRWDTSDDLIVLGTEAGGDTLNINESGQVGIGVSPSAKLHTLATAEQFRISYDTLSYTAFTQADTTGVLTIDPTGNCGKGHVVVDGAVKADSLAINGSVESYMVAIKSTSNTIQNFLLCEDSDGTNMFVVASGGAGSCYVDVCDTNGTAQVELNPGTDPQISIGEAITAGNYGYIKWTSSSDTLSIGTETGGDTLKVNENSTVTISGLFADDPPYVGQLMIEADIDDEEAGISFKTTKGASDQVWTLIAGEGGGTPNGNIRFYDATNSVQALVIEPSTCNVTIQGTLTVQGDQTGATDHVFDDYDDLQLLRDWRDGKELPFKQGDLINRDRLLRDAILQLADKLLNK